MRLFRRVSALLLVALAAACEEGSLCYPGDYQSCTCGESARGYQRCASEGEHYEACDCESPTPGTAPDAGGGGAGGGALLPFMSACDEDAQCESGLCYSFNAKGPHCTSLCKVDGDCPLPSTGCNRMGVCKAP